MNNIHLVVKLIEQSLNYDKDNWNVFTQRLSSLEKRIFELYLSNRTITDEEVAQEVFRSSFKEPNYKRHRKRLLDKLENEILFFNPSKRRFPTFQMVRIKCERLLTILKILQTTNSSEYSIKIARRIYTNSKKYKLTDLTIGACEYLIYHYSLIQPDTKLSQEYYAELFTCFDMRKAELYAESNYNLLAAKIVTGQFSPEELNQESFSVQRTLEEYRDYKNCSDKFVLSYFFYFSLLNFYSCSYNDALKFSQMGYEYVLNLVYSHPKAKSIFLSYISNTYLKLGQFPEAYQSIKDSFEFHVEGSNNWFAAKLCMIQIELYQRDYEAAAWTYYCAQSNRGFKKLPGHQAIDFLIYGGFLDYLFQTDRISDFSFERSSEFESVINGELETKIDHLPKFILRFFMGLQKRNKSIMDEAISMIELASPEKIRTSNPNFRDFTFAKMMTNIPKGYYKPVAIKRRTNSFLDKMKKVPFSISNEGNSLEILPYDQLWDIIMEDLEALNN